MGYTIENIRDLSAAVVSISLLVGVCWLVGTCAALGINTFGFVTTTDISRSALRICPFILMGVVASRAIRIAYPSTPEVVGRVLVANDRDKHLVSIRREAIWIFLSGVAAYLFAPAMAYLVYILISSSILLMRVGTYFAILNRENIIDDKSLAVSGTCVVCCLIVALGYLGSSLKINASDGSLLETICFSDGCREGVVVARLSEATFVRWENATSVTAVSNSTIESVTPNRSAIHEPVFDVAPALNKIWDWSVDRLGL